MSFGFFVFQYIRRFLNYDDIQIVMIILEGPMKTKQYYSTHEFANLIGVTSQTLRNWEKAGKLIPHHRGGGGWKL